MIGYADQVFGEFRTTHKCGTKTKCTAVFAHVHTNPVPDITQKKVDQLLGLCVRYVIIM